jgi:hypothetical protein
VEADFQRFYGLHLCDLGSHRLTWRRFGHLLAHLPPESATAREVRGGDGTVTNELLAHIANLLAGANWQRSGGKGNRPKPIRLTAGDDPSNKKIGTALPLDEMRRLLADELAFVDVGSEAVR